MDRLPTIYILASRRNGSLYVGVTTDIARRLTQHREGYVEHTRRYRIGRLVYLERHDQLIEAIAREKRIKRWRHKWKIDLIESVNPEWQDLTNVPGWIN